MKTQCDTWLELFSKIDMRQLFPLAADSAAMICSSRIPQYFSCQGLRFVSIPDFSTALAHRSLVCVVWKSETGFRIGGCDDQQT